jgi:hypothetical protein
VAQHRFFVDRNLRRAELEWPLFAHCRRPHPAEIPHLQRVQSPACAIALRRSRTATLFDAYLPLNAPHCVRALMSA